LLEKQEDILYEEHDKFVSVQKSLALETKRNEMLSSELSVCHELISSLKILNNDLNAKLEVANKSSSCVEHVAICNRCKDFDVDACESHAMFASSSNFNGRPRRNFVSHAPRKMCNKPTTIFHARNTTFVLSCKNEKVVARKLGSKCKGDKASIWIPKAIVTNLIGPNKSWVPKTQA
jgi:hypothetical protein